MLTPRALSTIVDMGDGGGWGLTPHLVGCGCRGMAKRRVGHRLSEGKKGGEKRKASEKEGERECAKRDEKGGVREGAAFEHAMCACHLWAEVFVSGDRWVTADPLRGMLDSPDMMRVILHVSNANGCPRTYEAAHQAATRVRFAERAMYVCIFGVLCCCCKCSNSRCFLLWSYRGGEVWVMVNARVRVNY